MNIPAEKVSRMYLTSDGKVSDKRSLLLGMVLATSNAAAQTIVIKDGESENAETVLTLVVPATSSFKVEFEKPVFFQKGIYIDLGTNCYCTIFFINAKGMA